LFYPDAFINFIAPQFQIFVMIRYIGCFIIIGTLGFHQEKAPRFEAQVVDSNISIGYGLAIGDVDGDGRPDILLADKKQFVWYRNGDWKRFVMVDNLTENDNVCIAARDIDGDGKVEVAVGAQWNPSETSDTTRSGSVHYLIRPKDPTKKWDPVRLHHEPTVHRMRWVMIGKGKYNLVVLPLHGRGNKNGEGAAVKVIGYGIPEDPKGKWEYTLIDQSMHLTHNFEIREVAAREALFIGGKEGLRTCLLNAQGWECGYEFTDKSLGEIRIGDGGYVGISPMHGNELIIHEKKNIISLSSGLNQGHALAVADLLDDGTTEIVAGWREPNQENKVGIKIFVSESGKSNASWKEFWVDDNGMACEDLQVADLNGDGKKDIIASGRATHNLKIYWNRN
jgi:hypothetical protein